MLIPVDYKKFQAELNALNPPTPYTEEDAVGAFHNLVGFVRLIRKVEREICARKNTVTPCV